MTPRKFSNQDRPCHFGEWPLERLPRDPDVALPDGSIEQPVVDTAVGDDSILDALNAYREMFEARLTGETAPARAPIPDDPAIRSQNLKSHTYFLDVDLAGCCRLDPADWMDDGAIDGAERNNGAIVFLQELPRRPEPGDPGDAWLAGTEIAAADVRLTEVAAVISGYLRAMGFDATGHTALNGSVDLARLAVRAGIVRAEQGQLRAPFLKRGFRIAAVTTAMTLEPDLPPVEQARLLPGLIY